MGMGLDHDLLFHVCGQNTDPEGVSAEVAQAVFSGTQLTFREGMDKARRQVDLGQFYAIGEKGGRVVLYRTKASDMANSFLMAMAEVYSAHPKKIFYVGREEKTADEIGFVFEQIDTKMLYGLVERMEHEARGDPVKYQRPYIRTMLYNEVFEAPIKETVNQNNTAW